MVRKLDDTEKYGDEMCKSFLVDALRQKNGERCAA